MSHRPQTDVLGVLLAAGTGSRFEDGTKLLAPLAGKPLVRHGAETLFASRVDDVVAIVGHDHERVAEAIRDADEDVTVLRNPAYGRGQATSVATGANVAADREAAAVVFALGDMPCIDPTTVDGLVDAFHDQPGDATIVVPSFDDRRGNPVLFGRPHFDELAALSGDVGGSALFATHPVSRVPVEDSGIHRDVDTIGDLDAILERCDGRDEFGAPD